MIAQIGLGVDLGRLILILLPLGLGFFAVLASAVCGALALRAWVRKAPAARFLRFGAAMFATGVALILLAFWLRSA